MEPALPPATFTAPTSPARECNPTPVLNSEVFEEEVSDIAQVHCENDLFEFELTDHPPLVNVKENLRRKLEFWKRTYCARLYVGQACPSVVFMRSLSTQCVSDCVAEHV